MALLHYFPEEFVLLSKEVQEHPPLKALLADPAIDDYPKALGVVAGYCEIAMDDYYSPKDLEVLSGILIGKLKDKRKMIVTSVGDSRAKGLH